MSRFLCVVPARGGSERLRGKNLLPLAGKPMIAYTIEAARECGLFDAVYVSTDSPEIAAQARSFGAQTPEPLPAERARPDQASMGACTWLHDRLKERGLGPWEWLFCLQPSSPLRTAEDLRAAAALVDEGRFEHVVSVTPIDPHYHHWAMRDREGFLEPVFGPEYQVDRQYLPEALRPNGAIKAMRTDLVGLHETFFDSRRVGYLRMPEERSVHVAFETDFLLAEALLRRRLGTRSGRLAGLTVLVTGATGQVGEPAARACAAEGARLVVTARRPEAAAALAAELSGGAVGLPYDGSSAEGVDALLADLGRRGLAPDALVYAARSVEWLGTVDGAPPWENWLAEYAVDVAAPYRLVEGLRPGLARTGRGSVVLVSSVYGLGAVNPSVYPDPSWASPPHYGASKAAVLQLVRDLAVRLAPDGVRVNAVTYGGVGGRLDEEFMSRYARLCPLGRMLGPEDLAEPVLFLASPGASGVTGHNLVVDGGWTSW